MIGTLLSSSPAEVQKKLIYGVPETTAMARGTIGHAAILEPEKIETEFRLLNREEIGITGNIASKPKFKKDGSPDAMTENLFRLQAWREKCAADGVTPIENPEEWDKINRIAGLLARHPFWKFITDGALVEHEMIWTSLYGCPMKGKTDLINDAYGVVLDVKFTDDVSPPAIMRAISDRMYNAQLCAYMDGYGKTTDKPDCISTAIILAVSIKSLEVVPYVLSNTTQDARERHEFLTGELGWFYFNDTSLQSGRQKYEMACKRWIDWNNKFGPCWETVEDADGNIRPVNEWPGWDYLTRFGDASRLKLFQI